MKTNKNLASIIIPTHNRAQYLASALQSIGNQSYTNFEVIIVANGCGNDTDQVISRFQKQFSQPIILLKFDQTLGGAKARNIGIDEASGEYIGFLDDDDYWHRDKLQNQIRLLRQNKYAIISSNFVYIYAKNQQKYARAIQQQHINYEDMAYENRLNGFSFCLTKRVYIDKSRINKDLPALQDWDLWLKILTNTGLPAYISQAHHIYKRLDGSRISNRYPQLINAQKIFLTHWQTCLDKDSIDYHRMRTMCLQLKCQSKTKYRRYLLYFFNIIRVIFNSPYRYKIKTYAHYLALPIMDIDAVRMTLWQ